MATFIVITKVPDTEAGEKGNLADNLLTRGRDGEAYVGVLGEGYTLIGSVRCLVFEAGEILIVDDNGREVGYPGRKPSKWSVEYEEFDDLDKAVSAALAVNERELRRVEGA